MRELVRIQGGCERWANEFIAVNEVKTIPAGGSPESGLPQKPTQELMSVERLQQRYPAMTWQTLERISDKSNIAWQINQREWERLSLKTSSIIIGKLEHQLQREHVDLIEDVETIRSELNRCRSNLNRMSSRTRDGPIGHKETVEAKSSAGHDSS